MGKGLGNGYPISGVLVRTSLAEKVETTGYHYVQSHIDDPLGCSVARKVIEIMVRENLVARGNTMGEYFRTQLLNIKNRTGEIDDVRGRGMMNVAVLNKTHKVKEVFKILLELGFFVGYSEIHNLLRFYSALTISTKEIDSLCSALELILTVKDKN